MKTKYKEIYKLKKMLEDAGIPFDWTENWGYDEKEIKSLREIAPDLIEHYQICYPKGSFIHCENRWISVIEGFGTFGAEQDRLEIMGGFTPWERYEYGDEPVMGHLTAHNVYQRIKNHWKEHKNMRKKIIKIDDETFKITETYIDVADEEAKDEAVEDTISGYTDALSKTMGCTSDEFYSKYKAMKKAEEEFKAIYEPLKAKVIELHETQNLPKNVIVGGAKLTYVSPSMRIGIDSKKLKEEEPENEKKFTKTTRVAATVKIEDIGGK